jgi:phosphomannomutase
VDVEEQALRWLRADPDPETRAELQALLDAHDRAGLAERFGARLEFGTAGIRGPLGAGPARMNRMVVRRVTAGLAARLLDGDVDAARGVVIGHDARHKSAVFADDAAGVLDAAGIPVHRIAGLSPTPLLAFAVRDLRAAAGVQITASHNPAADNGYKVYWSDGAQILPPLDAEISAAIDRVPADEPIPLGDDRTGPVDDGLAARYRAAVLPLRLHPQHADLRIVYTPLHGVAGDLVLALLRDAGFRDVFEVARQAAPDPDFPTVSFPNPEIEGALDLALETARASDADLILANDPDGDRIAAAIPVNGGWRALTGDEIGCLLAEWLLRFGPQGPGRLVATTVVSSRLLSAIAEHHDVGYAETLTGFKWLARAARDAAAEGGRMVLAYEQALGAMCGTAVLDKDGISAAMVLADIAATLRAEGRTIAGALDDLALRHGVYATGGRNVRLGGNEGMALVGQTLEQLRAAPPPEVGGVDVVEVADHVAGVRRSLPGGAEAPIPTPPTDLVGLTLVDGSRLQVRPSGTEPLLKFYAEVIEPVKDDDVAGARARAAHRLESLADAFLAVAGV